MFGLTVEEADGDAVEVWPDVVASVNVFIACATQWRVGMGGAVGLDYAAPESTLRLLALPRSGWPQVFDDIRIMEDEALKTMRKDR